MKKMLFLLMAFGLMAASSFAQTQRVNRTNSRSHTVPAAATPSDTVSEMRNSGVNGIDGTINDKQNSGNNRSSSFDNNPTQQSASPPGNNDPVRSNTVK